MPTGRMTYSDRAPAGPRPIDRASAWAVSAAKLKYLKKASRARFDPIDTASTALIPGVRGWVVGMAGRPSAVGFSPARRASMRPQAKSMTELANMSPAHLGLAQP